MMGYRTYQERRDWIEMRRNANMGLAKESKPIVLPSRTGEQTKNSRGARTQKAVKGMTPVVLDWKGKA